MPSPGKIEHLREPSGPGIRLDSGIYEGWTVPMEYDPLLAKLCAWASTRKGAAARLDRALAEYSLTGVRTNLALFREILADAEFRAGRLSTAYLDEFFKRRAERTSDPEAEAAAAVVLAMSTRTTSPPLADARGSRWRTGRDEVMR